MAQAQKLHPEWQDLVGQYLEERYRLDAVIAEGGMSVIFKGHHLRLNRDVALKILKPGMDDGGRQFLNEAESAARLNHPNCITVYDFGTASNGLNYMVMPYLQGEPLSKRVGVRMPPREVARLGIELFLGLEHAHEQGIIHRDLKPENLFLANEGDGAPVLKIVDFGIAKLKSDVGLMNATMSGLMSGTPTYMSPEQALGQETDERTDLYSAGVIFYTLLVGHPPFNEDDAIVVLRMHINGEMPRLPEDVPPGLARIVNRLIQKERKNRYASAREALTELEAFLDDENHGVAVPPPGANSLGDILAASAPVTLSIDPFEDDPSLEPRRSRRKATFLSLGALALAGVGAFGYFESQRQVEALPPAPQPQIVVAAPPPELPREDASAMLVEINDPKRARRFDYDERHAKLVALEQAGLAAAVDRRLQLRLDLQQAVQAATPCAAFRAALEAVRAEGAERWRRELARAHVPRPGAPAQAGRAPDEACEGLPEMLAELRGDRKPAQPHVENEPRSESAAVAKAATSAKRGKTKRQRARANRSTSAASETAARAGAIRKQEPAPAVAGDEGAQEPERGLSIRRLSDGPRRI